MSKPVLKLTLTNTTPLLIGWHDPHIQDPMGIRVTEVKGLWRWWCRAFVAGAMFDQGMLRGRFSDKVFLVPEPKEVKAISCLVGKILGLGYVGEYETVPSRFKLYIDIEGDISITKFRGRRQRDEYQRIVLLSLNQEVEGIDSNYGHRFILTVKRIKERYKDAEDLALKILIASLQLSGIGKGSRRGLGSLDILSMNSESISIDTKNAKKLMDEIYESVIEITNKYGDECEIRACCKNISDVKLPPLPTISKRKFNDVKIFQLFRIDIRNREDFRYVHNFFVRSQRCRQLKRRPDCEDDLRTYLSAWFLGLPREQRGTGYKMKLDSDKIKSGRRASPIILAYHSNKDNIFGQGIFVSIFISGDWPRELEWVGGRSSRPTEIDFTEISNAYKIFMNEFNTYLSSRGLTCIDLWP